VTSLKIATWRKSTGRIECANLT